MVTVTIEDDGSDSVGMPFLVRHQSSDLSIAMRKAIEASLLPNKFHIMAAIVYCFGVNIEQEIFNLDCEHDASLREFVDAAERFIKARNPG